MGLQICFACPNYPLTKKRGKLRFSTEKNKREIDRLVKLGIKLELYNGSMLCEFGILNFTQFLCSEGQKKRNKSSLASSFIQKVMFDNVINLSNT